MKQFIFLIILLFSVKLLKAQNKTEEPVAYKKFVKQFVADFNSANYSNITTYCSSSFLKSVPEKKLTDFLSGIKNDNGEIQLTHFKYYDAKQSAVYHAELKHAWFNFVFGLDSNNQLKRLVIIDPNYNEDLPVVYNKTKMELPFDSTWYVFWGGTTEDENYHVTVRSQKNAFDIMIKDSVNKSYKTDGKYNEDYYDFGKQLYSPCDGIIISMRDSVHDNIPGIMNPDQLTGNFVIIKSAQNEYILMAHQKQNSIVVKVGDHVKTGDLIGLCGNSGNSSEPHLHLHIMDASTLEKGTGIICRFEKLKVNGIIKNNYSPLRGERIEKVN